jgi:hypothetical protein
MWIAFSICFVVQALVVAYYMLEKDSTMAMLSIANAALFLLIVFISIAKAG